VRNPGLLTSSALIEALIIDVPETTSSVSMGETAETCCNQLQIKLTTVDAWTHPETVRKHRVLAGPTLILLAEGKEIGRLSGPSSRRAVRRLFDRVVRAPQPEFVPAYGGGVQPAAV